MRLWVTVLVACLLQAGCAYRVKLSATPVHATVELPDDKGTVHTPAEVTLRWVPFGHQRVRVSAPGYRVYEVDLRKSEIRMGRYITDALFRPRTLTGAPRGTVSFALVPLHGPAGTWKPEDAP